MPGAPHLSARTTATHLKVQSSVKSPSSYADSFPESSATAKPAGSSTTLAVAADTGGLTLPFAARHRWLSRPAPCCGLWTPALAIGPFQIQMPSLAGIRLESACGSNLQSS